MSTHMLVRKLTEDDLEAVWTLRLRALRDNPEAFGSTYEETVARGKAWMLQRLDGAAQCIDVLFLQSGILWKRDAPEFVLCHFVTDSPSILDPRCSLQLVFLSMRERQVTHQRAAKFITPPRY